MVEPGARARSSRTASRSRSPTGSPTSSPASTSDVAAFLDGTIAYVRYQASNPPTPNHRTWRELRRDTSGQSSRQFDGSGSWSLSHPASRRCDGDGRATTTRAAARRACDALVISAIDATRAAGLTRGPDPSSALSTAVAARVHDGMYRIAGARRTWRGELRAACWRGGHGRVRLASRRRGVLRGTRARRDDLDRAECPRWERTPDAGLVVHETASDSIRSDVS